MRVPACGPLGSRRGCGTQNGASAACGLLLHAEMALCGDGARQVAQSSGSGGAAATPYPQVLAAPAGVLALAPRGCEDDLRPWDRSRSRFGATLMAQRTAAKTAWSASNFPGSCGSAAAAQGCCRRAHLEPGQHQQHEDQLVDREPHVVDKVYGVPARSRAGRSGRGLQSAGMHPTSAGRQARSWAK